MCEIYLSRRRGGPAWPAAPAKPFTRAAADSFCEPNFSEKGTDDRQAGQADTWTQRRARALRSGWTDRNAADRSLKSINGTDGCGQTGRRRSLFILVE